MYAVGNLKQQMYQSCCLQMLTSCSVCVCACVCAPLCVWRSDSSLYGSLGFMFIIQHVSVRPICCRGGWFLWFPQASTRPRSSADFSCERWPFRSKLLAGGPEPSGWVPHKSPALPPAHSLLGFSARSHCSKYSWDPLQNLTGLGI